jgi:hypothetical protein
VPISKGGEEREATSPRALDLQPAHQDPISITTYAITSTSNTRAEVMSGIEMLA